MQDELAFQLTLWTTSNFRLSAMIFFSKSYLAKAKLKLERQRSEQRTEADARRLLDDPEMHKMARKALANPDAELFQDPEMQSIAKKALSDPTMMEAVMAVHKVQQRNA